MKMNKFARGLVAGVKVLTGVVLQLAGFVLWVPARIGIGVSEALTDIGGQLVKDESKPDREIDTSEAANLLEVVYAN